MRVGSINVDGRLVGVVNFSTDGPDDSMSMLIDPLISGHPLGFEPTEPKIPSGGSHGSHGLSEHGETPEEHKHNSIRYGHHVRHEPAPHTSKGNPFDRTRFDQELKEKPWLKEKIAHIAIGEHQSKEGMIGVTESMMNRAVVRGTSLEKQATRHRTSGVDEHGYYAGYAKHINDDQRAIFNKSLDEVLGHTGKGQSNITNYATENASGNLAAREMRDGSFVHRKEIEGEHFFSPGSAEPAFRDRWNKLHTQAVDFEKNQGNVTADGKALSPNVSGQPSNSGSDKLTPSPGRHPNISHVDSRLQEIVAAGAKHLPEGYKVGVNDAFNLSGHAPHSQHKTRSGALDVQIFDPQGKAIPNRGSDPTGLYTRLARASYGEMLARHPELKGHFAWGGSFGTSGGSGVRDLMHFDLGGERGHLYPHMSQLGSLPNRKYGAQEPAKKANVEESSKDREKLAPITVTEDDK